MTEIPDHLLERTRARRRALGLPVAGDDGGGADPGAAAGGGAAPAAAVPMKGPVAIPAGDAAPAAPVIDSTVVAAHKARKKIPVWAMPVVAALPIWAFIYAGTIQEPATTEIGPLEEGAILFEARCAACHGGSGAGIPGNGYQLNDGEVVATFPSASEHTLHVARGSAPIAGEAYGDPDRPGGQRIAGERGTMPQFVSALTDIEIELIVWHERITLAGEELEPAELATLLEDLEHRMEAGGVELDVEALAEKVAAGENPILDGHAAE